LDKEYKNKLKKNHIRKRKRAPTNRAYNCMNYYMMSYWDCYTLCLNTHEQIAEMAEQCQLVEGQMFLFWNRMYTYCSFEQQSTRFGISAPTLHRWWKETKAKLTKWSDKYLINSGDFEQQPWKAQDIHNETPEFIKRLHDPLKKGHVIITMDGTYIRTQQNQEHHGLRRLMWSPHKRYTLIKPHLICTLSGIVS